MTKNQKMRELIGERGKCMAIWCPDRTRKGACTKLAYEECLEFRDLEKDPEWMTVKGNA